MEMERAFLYGLRTEKVGSNGKKERTTLGLIPAIKTYGDSTNNISSFVTDTDTDFSGNTWAQAGEAWLDYYLAKIFRYGAREKLAFCGYNTVLAINKLAKLYGNIQLTATTKSYGLKVTEWLTPFGTIYLMLHPLFSYEDSDSRSMVIFEPSKLAYVPLTGRDTKLLPNRQANGVDGRIDEYLTECGLEYSQMKTAGYLTGFGQTNTA